jgi:hypothetical protein
MRRSAEHDSPPEHAIGSGSLARIDVARDPVGRSPLYGVEIVRSLKVHPELGRRHKVPRKPQGRVGRDAAATVDDLTDSRNRYAQITGEAVDADPERLSKSSRRTISDRTADHVY